MIEREIEQDILQGVNTKKILVADYGSNEGYFSIQLAKKLQQGYVFSFEGEAWEGTT